MDHDGNRYRDSSLGDQKVVDRAARLADYLGNGRDGSLGADRIDDGAERQEVGTALHYTVLIFADSQLVGACTDVQIAYGGSQYDARYGTHGRYHASQLGSDV